jgi:hypothetical protein
LQYVGWVESVKALKRDREDFPAPLQIEIKGGKRLGEVVGATDYYL